MTQTIQTQTMQNFRLETSNGVFTVFGFKPRIKCSVCHGKMIPRYQNHRSHANSTIDLCVTCKRRENGYFHNLRLQITSSFHYDENGQFYTEKVFKHWWIEKATINIEEKMCVCVQP